MTSAIEHLVEPESLLLVWQQRDEEATDRTRRVVGKITREPTSGEIELNYLQGTPDFEAAKASGFLGYPAFKLSQKLHNLGVLETFVRRLPPRKRGDFAAYLKNHWLAHPFELSDFALLGYTGAKLPGDGFTLVPVFNPRDIPCDCVMEVAGTRYKIDQLNTLSLGDALTLEPEPSNPVDSNALVVKKGDLTLGYVNRALLPTVHAWISNATVEVSLIKKNGKPSRPLLYVLLKVRPRS